MYIDVFKMPYLCSRSFTKKCFIPFWMYIVYRWFSLQATVVSMFKWGQC